MGIFGVPGTKYFRKLFPKASGIGALGLSLSEESLECKFTARVNVAASLETCWGLLGKSVEHGLHLLPPFRDSGIDPVTLRLTLWRGNDVCSVELIHRWRKGEVPGGPGRQRTLCIIAIRPVAAVAPVFRVASF